MLHNRPFHSVTYGAEQRVGAYGDVERSGRVPWLDSVQWRSYPQDAHASDAGFRGRKPHT